MGARESNPHHSPCGLLVLKRKFDFVLEMEVGSSTSTMAPSPRRLIDFSQCCCRDRGLETTPLSIGCGWKVFKNVIAAITVN